MELEGGGRCRDVGIRPRRASRSYSPQFSKFSTKITKTDAQPDCLPHVKNRNKYQPGDRVEYLKPRDRNPTEFVIVQSLKPHFYTLREVIDDKEDTVLYNGGKEVSEEDLSFA